jgi:hypothetical protein
MTKRIGLSKKTRFEVFKRDKFTCQYCGKSAHDVILVVDHIQPVASGGDNGIMNLIASCETCNQGKGARKLSDDATLAKQRAQLQELQERRDQLAMMMQWQRELAHIDQDVTRELCALWSDLVPGTSVNEHGQTTLQGLLARYNVAEICEAMRQSVAQYLKDDTDESRQKAFEGIRRILDFQRRNQDRPYMKDLFYIRGILKNKLSYYNPWQTLALLERAYQAGVETETLKSLALSCRNWTQWQYDMRQAMENTVEF